MAKRGAKKGESRRKGKPNKSTQEIRDIIHSCVDFASLCKKMVELVEGVEVQTDGKDGETNIYTQPPNVNAAKLLLEYGFGKPKEQMDLNVAINTAEIAKIFGEMVQTSGSGRAT